MRDLSPHGGIQDGHAGIVTPTPSKLERCLPVHHQGVKSCSRQQKCSHDSGVTLGRSGMERRPKAPRSRSMSADTASGSAPACSSAWTPSSHQATESVPSKPPDREPWRRVARPTSGTWDCRRLAANLGRSKLPASSTVVNRHPRRKCCLPGGLLAGGPPRPMHPLVESDPSSRPEPRSRCNCQDPAHAPPSNPAETPSVR